VFHRSTSLLFETIVRKALFFERKGTKVVQKQPKTPVLAVLIYTKIVDVHPLHSQLRTSRLIKGTYLPLSIFKEPSKKRSRRSRKERIEVKKRSFLAIFDPFCRTSLAKLRPVDHLLSQVCLSRLFQDLPRPFSILKQVSKKLFAYSRKEQALLEGFCGRAPRPAAIATSQPSLLQWKLTEVSFIF